MKNITQILEENRYMTIIKNKMAGAAVLIFLFSAVLISCSKSSSNNNNSSASSNKVSIANMAFSPASITVTAGTMVTWTNNDNMTHTVTADDGSYDSGNIVTGNGFSKTFTVAGTYAYHCTIHPSMTGTVIVK